jgi:cell division protein FtsB
MEDIRSDEDVLSDEERVEYNASADDEVPFHIPRD